MSAPYEQLSPEARDRLEAWAVSQRQLLAELLEDAGSDLQREFIDRAIVAGHTPAEVHAFADELRSMEDEHAFTACTLDADAPEGYTVNQLLRAESDPLYAFELKGGSLSPADDGGDAPVTTELSVDTSETGEPDSTPPRPPPVTMPLAPAVASPQVSGRPPVSSKLAPAAPPPAAAPSVVVSAKDLAPPGTMSPSGTLRPKDLAPSGTMSPSGTLRPKDLAPSGTASPSATLRPKDLAPAGSLTPGGSKRPASADTQPQPAFRPPPPGVATPGTADTRPHAAFKPSAGSDVQTAFKAPLPGTSGPAPADTQPHQAFKPSSAGAAALGSTPFRPPPPGVAMPGTGVTPAFKPDPARELGGAAVAPSGTHRSGGGLPMSPRDSGAPPIPARMLARELGGSPDSARRALGSSGALSAVPAANKLLEDALGDACRPFGLSFREYDVDLDTGTTLEQALEQAAVALQRGVMVPVCLGPQPGQHRRFAVLMQLSVVGANRAWQLYEMTTQELMWMNEGDLLARKELPFANKVNRRITRVALPNIKASDF